MKLKITLLSFLMIGVLGYAQSTKKFNVIFNHVALSVKDLDKSAEFYKEVLGLEEISNRTEKAGIRWFSLGEDKELHLISTISGEITLNKAVHFAISIGNFDDFIQNLKNLKVEFSDWEETRNKISIRADGIRQIYIQDPDGYWIEVNSVGN